jgi:hypothetical protein
VRYALLAFIAVVALLLRVHALGAFGFGEDEVAKLRAIEAYRQGAFAANAEHPMLMKLAIWASLSMADAWNDRAPMAAAISPEAALRLPNAVAGTATTVAVYGCAFLLFGAPAALVAATFVALDPTIIAINRLGKEDSFLILFFLIAVFCYERAKQIGARDPEAAQVWYRSAGASFGLMLASKYLPHLFGLYALYNVSVGWNAGANAPRARPYHLAMLGAFLLANPAVLLPSTWAYCLEYIRGGHSVHHGYFYGGSVHVNAATIVVHGVPWYYYLHLIATKVPLVVLAAAAAGLVPLVRRRRERGFIFLRVFLVVQLLGYAVFASKFQRYALPLLIVIDLLAAVGVAWLWQLLRARAGAPALRVGLAAAGALMLASLLRAPMAVAPFYSTYQNGIGRALAPPVRAFPEEAYDYGVREAVGDIIRSAAPGAVIVSDASMVVEYYLRAAGREDLRAATLSSDSIQGPGERWVLVQDSHIYFENEMQIAQLRQAFPPWREYRIRGTTVLQVFRLVL